MVATDPVGLITVTSYRRSAAADVSPCLIYDRFIFFVRLYIEPQNNKIIGRTYQHQGGKARTDSILRIRPA